MEASTKGERAGIQGRCEGGRGAGRVYIANRGCDNHNTDLSEGLSVASLWLYTVTMKQETVLMPKILNLFLRSKK